VAYAHAGNAVARARATTARATPRIPLKLCVLGMGLIAFYSTRPGGYPISDWFFIAGAGAVIMTVLAERAHELQPPEARRAPTAVTIASLGLLTAGTISTLWSADPMRSITVVSRLAWLSLGWLWLFRSVTVDRTALHRMIRAFRVTVLISSIVAITGYLGVLHLSKEDPSGRQMGFHAHPNHLGALLALGSMFFVLDLDPAEKGKRSMLPMRWIGLGIALFGTATSGSMTAAIACVVGSLTIVATRYLSAENRPFDPLGPIKRMGMLVVVALFIVWLSQGGSSVVERFTRLGEGEGYTQESANSRAAFTSYVFDHFDQYLVVGAGFDAESPTETSRDEGDLQGANHNMPLKILYQAGLPALVAMTVLVIVTLRMAWTLVLSTRGTALYSVAVTLFASVVAVNVVAQTQPMTYEREYWLPYALVAGLWALRRRELMSDAGVQTASVPVGAVGRNGSNGSNGDHPEVGPQLGHSP
jgi:hypothetical protein